jgi:XTP/dITP diphosphohydrolase
MTRSASVASRQRPKLAIASSNPGKLAEFQSLLGSEVDILSLADLGLDSPEETGVTFEANAELKARFVFSRTGFVTLADDSGLEVDALDGQPGVRSARYAGEQHDDAANRRLLLQALVEVPMPLRTARFVAAIAVVDANGSLFLSRGACEGQIARGERGSGGFGYDSLFELPDGRTMAELRSNEKNEVSHRSVALRSALPGLRSALKLDVPEESLLTP